MKKLITITLAIILAVSLAACEPSGVGDTDDHWQVGPVEDYRIIEGWNEGDYITTSEGHRWKVENPNNYTGAVLVSFDGKCTETPEDDTILLIIERG